MARTKGAKDKAPRKLTQADSLRRSQIFNPIAENGYNAKSVKFLMEIMPLNENRTTDVAELERRFERYLTKCAEYDVKISNMAAYGSMGFNKQEVDDYMSGYTKPSQELWDLLKKVQKICSTMREKDMGSGKLNPAVGIFWQKNYDAMQDKQEVVITPNRPLGAESDPDALKKKYIENTYGVEEGTQPLSDDIIDV